MNLTSIQNGLWRSRALQGAVLAVLIIVGTVACQPINSDTLAALRDAATAIAQQPSVAPVGPEGAVRNENILLNNGTMLNYSIVLPPNYQSGTPYPTLLALPPGSQTQSMVNAGLDSYWQAGALANGWVVISPVAPNGQLFFQGAETSIPIFLDAIATRYPFEGDKVHLAGVSNGGISAFRIAGLYPERIHSLIALPGYPQTAEDQANLAAFTSLPIALFVGANDSDWIDPMRETTTQLTRLGATVSLEIVPDEGHFIRSLIGGEDLFGLLEEFRGQ